MLGLRCSYIGSVYSHSVHGESGRPCVVCQSAGKPSEPAAQVRVLGEAYTPEDEEDSSVAEITAVWAYQARYRIPLTKAIAGAQVRMTATAFLDLYSVNIRLIMHGTMRTRHPPDDLPHGESTCRPDVRRPHPFDCLNLQERFSKSHSAAHMLSMQCCGQLQTVLS